MATIPRPSQIADPPPSFYRWLMQFRGLRKAEGRIADLADDAWGDPVMPRCRTLESLRKCLDDQRACDAALETLDEAWARYQREMAAR